MTRHWFPVIAVGSTCALLLVVGWVFVRHQERESEKIREAYRADMLTPALDEDAYYRTVRMVLAAYEADGKGEAAYDAVLAIRHIPESLKDAHISIVAALGKIAAGDVEEGRRRLDVVKSEYPNLAQEK